MEWIAKKTGFEIVCGGEVFLRSEAECPMVFIGSGEESVSMHRGYYDITDHITERIPLAVTEVTQKGQSVEVNFSDRLTAVFELEKDRICVKFHPSGQGINRFWLRIPAEKEEACYGCGEQFSYFNLRGRHFP